MEAEREMELIESFLFLVGLGIVIYLGLTILMPLLAFSSYENITKRMGTSPTQRERECVT